MPGHWVDRLASLWGPDLEFGELRLLTSLLGLDHGLLGVYAALSEVDPGHVQRHAGVQHQDRHLFDLLGERVYAFRVAVECSSANGQVATQYRFEAHLRAEFAQHSCLAVGQEHAFAGKLCPQNGAHEFPANGKPNIPGEEYWVPADIPSTRRKPYSRP